MSYRHLSDSVLEVNLKTNIRREKKLQIETLHMLAEVERRRMYSKNHSSLFDYCVKVLELSNASAQARIATMRAMKLIPEIEEKLLSNELNLTNVAMAQTFFNQEKKLGKTYSLAEKREVLEKLENKSGRECYQELVKISPNSVPKEQRRQLTEDKVEIKIVVDQKLIAMLGEIKDLCSHKNPNMTDGELLGMLAQEFLKRKTASLSEVKVRKNTSATEVPLRKFTSVNEVRSRYIPASIKREVFNRDHGQCTHPGCGSKRQIEYDHIKPIALGGTNTTDNLRLLCRTQIKKPLSTN